MLGPIWLLIAFLYMTTYNEDTEETSAEGPKTCFFLHPAAFLGPPDTPNSISSSQRVTSMSPVGIRAGRGPSVPDALHNISVVTGFFGSELRDHGHRTYKPSRQSRQADTSSC